jgi:cytochrome c556
LQGGDANGNLSEIVTRRNMFHDSMNRMTAIAGVTTGTGPWDGWLQASQYPAIHSSAFLYDPDGRPSLAA